MLAAVLVAGSMAPAARADGDPGSDVLVYQDLFTGSAGLSVRQQLQFSALLKAAARAGFPVRVAIIASPSDLGAVTSLWRNPRAYAKFLGLELSLAYKQRLLVVMPNGFGFSWPKHSTAPAYELLRRISIGSSVNGLLGAAQTAVQQLAKANGVKLPSVARGPRLARPGPGAARERAGLEPGASRPIAAWRSSCLCSLLSFSPAWPSGGHCVGVAFLPAGAQARVRRPPRSAVGTYCRQRLVLFALLVTAPILVLAHSRGGGSAQREALAFNPYLDPGTPLSRVAPDFTLSDQFGQRVSLHSFRGKVVILAFNDSECTTECPLTTSAMLDAKAMLGAAGSRVQLLGIDANPAATSLEDVWAYSELHGMQHAWRFLTGSRPELTKVWRQYGVQAAVERGQITHTPALFVIDSKGREARVYITQMSYSAIGQLGQLLAHEASSLLPSHPRVNSEVSYSRVPPITPAQIETLPRAGGGSVQLGPGRSARLYVFFATWDRETSALSGQLDGLNSYAAAAARLGLPPVTAVDEESVEPSSRSLGEFLRSVPHPLSYPVAIDRTGRVADGYEVLGVPWFVLVSRSGQILYYRSVSAAGWPSRDVLIRYMRAALARAPRPSATVPRPAPRTRRRRSRTCTSRQTSCSARRPRSPRESARCEATRS